MTQLLFRNLSVGLDHNVEDLGSVARRKLRVRGRLTVERILRRSLDMRRRRPPAYLYTLVISVDAADEVRLLDRGRLEPYNPAPPPEIPVVERTQRPVVLGAGPAGLFAAYRLAQAGTPAVVIERGQPVIERSKQWYGFLKGGAFDRESHLLFGEGGAGTYSDGKLYTRVKDPRGPEILKILADCGAPAEILYDAKPHIGSNLLPSIVRRLREDLVGQGTEFRFSTCMTDVLTEGGRLVGIRLEPGGVLRCDTLMLGLGHSARDTLRMLHARGVAMSKKPFQLGVRVEHPQSVVNGFQYREYAHHSNLPPADYRLVEHLPGGDVFSFCMCPGGEILPATEHEGFVCVNGASRHQRIGEHANSGFVVTLEPERFPGDVFAGIALQEDIERKAANLADHAFGAPALGLVDFLERRVSRHLPGSSYPLPLTAAPFEEFLPSDILASLREGLAGICRRIPAFKSSEAIIVGPESRSSCPVRIDRAPESFESTTVRGLYPIGEGAGYAGGILSAAIDGMLAAEAWVRA